MSLVQVDAAEATQVTRQWDCVIDARSPAEFAEDHLPGALNWPTLDNDERHTVGLLYKQVSPHEARKVGAAMAARRIASHVESYLGDTPREWRPLVYCWRGGQRSGSLATILSAIGFRAGQLTGGYRAFRTLVRADLDTLPLPFKFIVLCGRTGSGKTKLLQALGARGEQVLDLEALAKHRGSILGAMPCEPQPTQKRFDTLVWQALRGFASGRPVFVESESARIGSLRVPEVLLAHLRGTGLCIRVDMDEASRIRLLTNEYAELISQPDAFCQLLEGLVPMRGLGAVAHWQLCAQQGRWHEVISELMAQHYDPLYERSMQRSFSRLETAATVILSDVDNAALDAAALALLARLPAIKQSASF